MFIQKPPPRHTSYNPEWFLKISIKRKHDRPIHSSLKNK
jgi:hypothetical protein